LSEATSIKTGLTLVYPLLAFSCRLGPLWWRYGGSAGWPRVQLPAQPRVLDLAFFC
jgi:hypothetical protein